MGLTNHFNINIVFKISMFEIPKFNCFNIQENKS